VELLSGAKDERQYAELRDDFSVLPLLEIDAVTWEAAGRSAFELRRKGITVPVPDLLIATVACQHAATLLHADKHFDLIAPHLGLTVESLVHVVQAPH
jgi:hypothetical protein